MSSNSRSQQRLFGWVHACQKGTAKNCPENISKVAGSISYDDAEDFAKTKHKGLPERKMKKKLKSYQEFCDDQLVEQLSSVQKDMAGMMMSSNTQELIANAKKAGVPVDKIFNILARCLELVEKKLNVGDQNAGEFHVQAFQTMSAILGAVQGGKRQWNARSQVNNAKKVQQQPAFPSNSL